MEPMDYGMNSPETLEKEERPTSKGREYRYASPILRHSSILDSSHLSKRGIFKLHGLVLG